MIQLQDTLEKVSADAPPESSWGASCKRAACWECSMSEAACLGTPLGLGQQRANIENYCQPGSWCKSWYSIVTLSWCIAVLADQHLHKLLILPGSSWQSERHDCKAVAPCKQQINQSLTLRALACVHGNSKSSHTWSNIYQLVFLHRASFIQAALISPIRNSPAFQH